MAAKLQIELVDSGGGQTGAGIRAPIPAGIPTGGGVGAGAGIPRPPTPAATGQGSANAGGNVGGAIQGALPMPGGIVGRVASAAGPVGLAIGAVAGFGIAIKSAVGRLIGALDRQSELLADYSPEVAEARFQSEMRRENALRRRAEEIGPQLARFEKARSRMQDRLFDIQTQVQEILLELWEGLEPFLTKCIDILEAMVAGIKAGIDLLQMISAAMVGDYEESLREMKEWMKSGAQAAAAIQRIFEDREDEDDFLTDPNIERFLASPFNVDGIRRRVLVADGP